MLKTYVDVEGQSVWDQHINKVLMAYRSSVHSATNETPHFLAHGWDAATITDRVLGVQKDVYSDVESFSEYLSAKLQLAWQVAIQHIKHAQDKMKRAYDKDSFEPMFRIGSKVTVFFPNTAPKGLSSKFSHPFRGPYRIIKLGSTNAVLKSIVHPHRPPYICHKNRLKLLEDDELVAPARKISSEDVASDLPVSPTGEQVFGENPVPKAQITLVPQEPIPIPAIDPQVDKYEKENELHAQHRYPLRSRKTQNEDI